jgi:hypothetical protein
VNEISELEYLTSALLSSIEVEQAASIQLNAVSTTAQSVVAQSEATARTNSHRATALLRGRYSARSIYDLRSRVPRRERELIICGRATYLANQLNLPLISDAGVSEISITPAGVITPAIYYDGTIHTPSMDTTSSVVYHGEGTTVRVPQIPGDQYSTPRTLVAGVHIDTVDIAGAFTLAPLHYAPGIRGIQEQKGDSDTDPDSLPGLLSDSSSDDSA